ncbi:MAG: hypothetical protein COC19_04995 [SAR86 cluster bacterium]|uniref:Uncharacterized protein n=1 Tax=SAR86 cluster bacterium TaxID=2030880 RepID=A0A2A4MME9_9GAMM|nr:MAG: hypothetical protein COC19_04995 [SAR86 cluster bacterium]
MKLLSTTALCLLSSVAIHNALAQDGDVWVPNVWYGLERTTLDTAASTLRIPCVKFEDENGDLVAGYGPAFALNLQVIGDTLRLVGPSLELSELPQSCLDTLTLSNDGNFVNYTTSSAELDSDRLANAKHYYSLDLSADISTGGEIAFIANSVTDRFYTSPVYNGESFLNVAGVAPLTRDFIYDDDYINEALGLMYADLTVFEAGRTTVECGYVDNDNVLEVVEIIGSNTRYRLKSSLTTADNGKQFSISCPVFNHDLNRLELVINIVTWNVFLE